MSVTIDDDIKVTPPRSNPFYNDNVPVAKLQPGQSVFVSLQSMSEASVSIASLRAFVSRVGSKCGFKTAVRLVDGGYRVWRLEE